MADLKISDLPTDIVDLAAGDKFPVADVSALTANTFCTAGEIKDFVLADTYWRILTSDYTLIATASMQELFPTPNKLTLATGFYEAVVFMNLNSMSVTSGNASFTLEGPGSTAVIANPTIGTVGIDGAGTAAQQTGTWVNATTTPGNMLTATASIRLFVRIRSTFSVTTAGLMVPGIALANPTGGVTVGAGSYIRVNRFSDLATGSKGPWS